MTPRTHMQRGMRAGIATFARVIPCAAARQETEEHTCLPARRARRVGVAHAARAASRDGRRFDAYRTSGPCRGFSCGLPPTAFPHLVRGVRAASAVGGLPYRLSRQLTTHLTYRMNARSAPSMPSARPQHHDVRLRLVVHVTEVAGNRPCLSARREAERLLDCAPPETMINCTLLSMNTCAYMSLIEEKHKPGPCASIFTSSMPSAAYSRSKYPLISPSALDLPEPTGREWWRGPRPRRPSTPRGGARVAGA